MPRSILHVDMDAFYASVEQRDDPRLRGKPVLVGHDGPRGVVAAASYEARAFGCRSAQPMVVAKRHCPHAVIVSGRHDVYSAVSREVFDCFHEVTPLVEPLSIDEAFLDVTGSTRLLGPPVEIAKRIKARVREATDLAASVGVAPNKFLAKLVSEWDKPDGLTVITADEVLPRLVALPLRAMWGVGPAAERRLARDGFRTFGDLHAIDLDEARLRLGREGERMWRLARGIDERPVSADGGAKSIGHEQTFGHDLEDPEAVADIMRRQTDSVGGRLRRHDLVARTVTIKLRYGDFETITRSHTMDRPTNHTRDLWVAARMLFDRWCAEGGFRPIRLAGVTAQNLDDTSAGQLDLFGAADDERQTRLDAAADAITKRFGHGSIGHGLVQPRGESTP